MGIECPIECVNAGCPEADFLEEHGALLLTVLGFFGSCLGMMITYFLRSRCKTIRCCGASCERDVIALDAGQIEMIKSNVIQG